MSKKAQNQKLLLVNAHYLRRLETSLPEDLKPEAARRELNVQLALWLPGWLDELSDELLSEKKDSPNREKAVARCLAAIEAQAGIKFPEPHIISTEGLDMNQVTSSTPSKKVTSPSKPIPAKKPVTAKSAPKAAAKPAAKAPTKAAAKAAPEKKDGEFEKQLLTLVQKDNPKRPGTDAHKRYGYYSGSKTVGEFLKKGGTALDIRYDKKAGYIRLVKPK